MLIAKDQLKQEVRVAMRQGPGQAVLNVLDASLLPTKSRMFGTITLEKDCGIGLHEHVNETEFYYILGGKGLVDEGDTQFQVVAGDTVLTGGGASHSIVNIGDEPLELLAVIVLD